MSWDVMVFYYHGDPPKDISQLPVDYRPDPLGPAKAVRETIAKSLPGVDWSDPTWGLYLGDGFSFEFNTGQDDPIDTLMVHVRGGGDAISSLLRFATPNKWSLLDCSTGKFIDPDDPAEEGWEGFQAFRDRVIEHYRDEDEA